jgi:hypothetical protein
MFKRFFSWCAKAAPKVKAVVDVVVAIAAILTALSRAGKAYSSPAHAGA